MKQMISMIPRFSILLLFTVLLAGCLNRPPTETGLFRSEPGRSRQAGPDRPPGHSLRDDEQFSAPAGVRPGEGIPATARGRGVGTGATDA